MMCKMAHTLALCGSVGKKALRPAMIFTVFSLIFLPFGSALAKEEQLRLQSAAAKRKTIEMIRAARGDDWAKARSLAGTAEDPLAAKIFLWLRLTDPDKTNWDSDTFIRLTHFIRANPDWPGITKMKVAAEGAMPENISNAEVIAWYDDFAPQTAYGLDRYMSAMIINGKRDEAKKFLTGWWAGTVLPREQQRNIFKKYNAYLTRDAHARRLDLLLLNEGYESAQAIAGVLGNGYPQLTEARMGLARNSSNAAGLVAKVPKHLQNDAGLLFERLRWRRKKDLNAEAIEILAIQPPIAKIQNPDEWWKERNIMIRRMMEQRQHKKAYTLAAKHGLKEGPSFAEAEWLAGWIALRFNHQTSVAMKHFAAMYESVESPMSKTRGAYWAGRAQASMGKKDQANEWYRKASKFQTYYYGQLSAAALSEGSNLPADKGHAPSDGERQAFRKDELVQAYHLFYEAGEEDSASRFIQAFLESHDTPQAYYYAAENASSRGDYYDSVKISKDAARKGLFLTKQAYPAVPEWLRGIDNVEWALAHSLIRQESMFDQDARSSAGALGLMQLMPRTAKETAGKIGLGYNVGWLTTKPDYNIKLGTTYISRLLNKYDGSYPLAVAAYNAGPGRVNEWLEAFGDPRTGEVDYLDWIEQIPIYETRNYVQRVMEGVYVYRLRLNGVQQKPHQQIHISYHIQP